jgi:hypothetical protein
LDENICNLLALTTANNIAYRGGRAHNGGFFVDNISADVFPTPKFPVNVPIELIWIDTGAARARSFSPEEKLTSVSVIPAHSILIAHSRTRVRTSPRVATRLELSNLTPHLTTRLPPV